MKKFVITTLTFLLFIFATACEKAPDYSDRISQLRSEIFVGESDLVTVICYAEEREQPYISDGNVDEKVFILIFKLTSKNELSENLHCSFSSDKEFQFEAKKNDLNYGYVESIIVDKLPSENFDLNVGDETISLNQINASACITYQNALIAVKEKNSLLFDNIDCSEIHIRLIYENCKLFWYVGIINKESTNAFLIDGTTAEIIAEKVIKNEQ